MEVPLLTVATIVARSTLIHLINKFGYAAVFAIVACESFGLPVPGETTLEAASVYAGSTHRLDIYIVWFAAALGAIVGDNIGYLLGRVGGYRVLLRWGRYVRLDESKLKVGKYLFAEHGGKVVFFGRFIMLLRPYAAFLAGTNRMNWLRFLFFNAAGGILWAAIFAAASYEFGTAITSFSRVFDYALGVAGIGVTITIVLVLRAKSAHLTAKAEAAFPGPLRHHLGTEPERAEPASVS